ncbi:hypothetical protein RHAL1_02896 [Beijerinckiaceae bacterium RH AL1]|jgi:hypothetical protein|nr:DUF2937 family protein [Beijerinckiaceae bacterium]VVB47601.1 hypothetical protein RHCH11_RHCH11_02835 [Beijerinckiaceae bacterium RH CH11]VVB47682.1 hypothetical protein RHAL8_02831 [Beijerinckiaceae bacterium RH AL8]VVC55971.1 hypothetical protein RHAL1_02896 [Beijerinckiaceae bacterium RH AL1]
MIFRRIAFFIAALCGLAMTQLPEFVQQYQQRLGGAIDELAAVVARFDSDSAQHGMTQAAGIDRLHENSDKFVRERGDEIQDDIVRLANLRDAQAAFKNEGALQQIVTFATHYDQRIARGAYNDFAPAVPTSPEALALGLFGFVFAGGVVHLTGHQVRRRRRVPAGTTA